MISAVVAFETHQPLRPPPPGSHPLIATGGGKHWHGEAAEGNAFFCSLHGQKLFCTLTGQPPKRGSCCAQLVNPEISKYRDRRFDGNQEEFERTLRESTTVYVGNLSFFTTEEQIYEVRPYKSVYLCWQHLCIVTLVWFSALSISAAIAALRREACGHQDEHCSPPVMDDAGCISAA